MRYEDKGKIVSFDVSSRTGFDCQLLVRIERLTQDDDLHDYALECRLYKAIPVDGSDWPLEYMMPVERLSVTCEARELSHELVQMFNYYRSDKEFWDSVASFHAQIKDAMRGM